MRARLAIWHSGLKVELREILLRNKPAAFLATSPSGTVPTLRLPRHASDEPDDLIIDESIDIMIWALKQSDPHGLLQMPARAMDLISMTDGPFKAALDHTKYSVRFPDLDVAAERAKAARFLHCLNDQLSAVTTGQLWLFGERPTLADFAILPFIRQFAHIDRAWFDGEPWPQLIAYLDRFLASDSFSAIMAKYPPWTEDADPIWFGKRGIDFSAQIT